MTTRSSASRSSPLRSSRSSAVWFHFFRTRSRALWPPWRWSPKGFLLGVAAVVVVLVVHAAIVLSVAYALGMPLEE